MRIITKDYRKESPKKSRIKEDIIQILANKKECMFGQIIQEINQPYTQITNCIMELKQNGIVTNETNPPYYTLCKY